MDVNRTFGGDVVTAVHSIGDLFAREDPARSRHQGLQNAEFGWCCRDRLSVDGQFVPAGMKHPIAAPENGFRVPDPCSVLTT